MKRPINSVKKIIFLTAFTSMMSSSFVLITILYLLPQKQQTPNVKAQGAPSLFVYSDAACPAGTTDSGRLVHIEQNGSVYVWGTNNNTWFWSGTPGNQPVATGVGVDACVAWVNALGTHCFNTTNVGVLNTCYRFISHASAGDSVWSTSPQSCIAESVPYISYRLCKWLLQ